MTRRTVLITGAGFSKPANGPLLPELLEPEWVGKCALPTADVAVIESLSRRLHAPQESPAQMSVEDLFTDLYRRAKTRGSWDVDGKSVSAESALVSLQRYLASTAKTIHLRRGSILWEGYKDFFTEASRTAHRPTVITFNYDLLIEQILDDAGLDYDFGGVQDIRIFDRRRLRRLKNNYPAIRLLKLHGSIGWGLCHGCESAKEGSAVATVFEEAYIPRSRSRCPYCGDRMLDPGLVPPINGKAGEIAPKEGLWERARYEIGRATEILVIGYSLPSTDFEAHSLLSESIANPGLESIISICGHSGASPAIKGVFPTLTDSRAKIEEILDGTTRLGVRWWRAK
jgi:NAD-dependent SIR2 family protein deacetylase